MYSKDLSQIPISPLQYYEESNKLDKDYFYMMGLVPSTASPILHEINDECDKLEYEGSFMFDEFPDKERLIAIANRIALNAGVTETLVAQSYPPYRPPFPPEPPRGHYPPPPAPPSDNPLNALIFSLLANEMLHRRRRYRCRRNWDGGCPY